MTIQKFKKLTRQNGYSVSYRKVLGINGTRTYIKYPKVMSVKKNRKELAIIPLTEQNTAFYTLKANKHPMVSKAEEEEVIKEFINAK